MGRFSNNRNSVKDDGRKGGPQTSVTWDIIVKVETYV